MSRSLPVLVAAAVLATGSSAAAQFAPPTRPGPPPSTAPHLAAIKEGIALHAKGDYDGALARYAAVLAETPDDLLAMYETALTLTAKKDFAKAIEVALKGAEYDSAEIGSFYNAIGNVYVQLAQPQNAIRAFEYGIERAPNEAQLHYNVAVSYAGAGRRAEALGSMKTAVTLRPDYGSAHYSLAVMFLSGGYPVPALLAAGRYLTLDPTSARGASALSLMNSILRDSPQQSRGGGPASPVPSGRTDEGDFGRVEEIIYAGRPRRTFEQVEATPEIQLLVEQMTSIARALAASAASGSSVSFAYQYYVPYFVEMHERGLVSPFVHYVYQRAGLPGAAEWLKANDAAVKALLDWSMAFQWARPGVRSASLPKGLAAISTPGAGTKGP